MASNAAELSSNVIATKYAYVAAATLLFWDIGLTFDEEIARVWKAKKTLGTTLFFCNRYLPPAIFFLDLVAQFIWDPSDTFCKQYKLSSTLLDLVAITVVEAVLIMRTHALYQSQRLLYGLSALAVVAIVNMTACFLIILPHLTFVPAARKIGLVGCLSGCTHPICQPLLITFWIPFLLFETSVFLLTAWKSYETYKIARNTRSLKLVTILFRDGFIYYIVIICVSLINFMIWIFDPFASYLAVGLMKSLQATICSRLLLNIRGMLEPRGMICPDTGRTDGFTLSTISQSSIRQSNYQLPPPRRISWPSFSGDPFCLDEHEAGSSGDRKCSEEGVRTDRG